MRLRRKRVEAAAPADAAPVRSGRMATLGDGLARRLAALSPREQKLVGAGAGVLLLALVVGVGVLPAWRSLQQGPVRQQALHAQVLRVAQLEAQAQAIKTRPRWSGAEAAIKLQASSAGLAAPSSSPGPASGAVASADPLQLSLSPTQAQATLRALPADTLAAWLTAAREQAHAVPTEAKLTREAVTPEGADRWSGALVMRLPP